MKETWDNNCIIPLYDNTNQVCGIIHNDSAYYFLKNLQGDVIAITDDAGNTVARYKYDAWGECTIEWANCAIGVINPFRYRSYYYDNETGFYYLNSRYYDPKICRFINADDACMLTMYQNNLLVYCDNNPINKIDRLGYCSTSVLPKPVIQKNEEEFKIDLFSAYAKEFLKYNEPENREVVSSLLYIIKTSGNESYVCIYVS